VVTRSLNTDATLSALSLSSGTLTPNFDPATTSYTSTVSTTTSTLTVTPTVNDPNATVTVNGSTVSSGTASGNITLNYGPNTITTQVTAQDGSTQNTYTVVVTRSLNTDATLSALSLSSGTLTPNFDPATTSYTSTVSTTTSTLTVTPTVNDPNATVTVNGSTVSSGTASGNITLNYGPNTITTLVTAQDGSTQKTYTVVVIRSLNTDATLSALSLSSGTLTPNFSGSTTNYTATVSTTTSTLTVTPTVTDPNATVTVNGSTVSSGTASGNITLNYGTNTITTLVTAQDGSTQNTYTVMVTRSLNTDATLSALSLSSGTITPNFSGSTTNYTATVSTTTSTLTVTPTVNDPNATVTVNGSTVSSGTASGNIVLNYGPNTITTQVTAQDGSTQQSYTVIVTRNAPSHNDALSYLNISKGTLSPSFAPGTTSYTVSVPSNVYSVTVKAGAEANATLTVNGTPLPLQTASGSILLNTGSNTITITDLAQDGVTSQSYTIVVTKALSTNDNLSYLNISHGTLSPAFSPLTTSYTATVGNNVNAITLKAGADPNATLTVNGTALPLQTASGSIPLVTGDNTITITDLAQDGSTSQNYTIVVTKAASTNDLLSYLNISKGTLSPVFSPVITSYTSAVSSNVTTITVKAGADPNATLTLNGSPLALQTASAAIPLAIGDNTLTLTDLAQDGVTSQSYTVVVTRASPPPANSFYQAAVGVSRPTDSLQYADGISVHQGVSPNGDGINDYLVIDGITAYPNNKLTIMNSNGNLVFEGKNYDNGTSARVFDGHSSLNGAMQRAGTYFYSLEYNTGDGSRRITGYIILKY
jgi:gliding motility-associated-like protein